MVILGLILWILGTVLNVPVLVTIGWVVGAIGLVLLLIGMTGRSLGGRRYWW